MGGRTVGTTMGAALAALVLAGCSIGTPTVAQEDVEKTVSDQLEAQVGQAPDKITCPGDLEGKVGTEMRCTLEAGGDTLGLTVTVTKVEGKSVSFDIQVDETTQGGS